jgi:hypothetical protein
VSNKLYQFEEAYGNLTLDIDRYYSIEPLNVSYWSKKDGLTRELPRQKYALHSGLPYTLLRPDLLRPIIAAYQPKPTLYGGRYLVDCKAKTHHSFEFQIDLGFTKWSYFAGRAVLRDSQYNPSGKCSTFFQPSTSSGPGFALGTPFFYDFVTTFDLDEKRLYLQKWL